MYAQHSLISTYLLQLEDKSDIEWASQEFGFTGETDFPAISFFVNGESVHTLRANSPRRLFSPIQVEEELRSLVRYVGERDIKVYRLLQVYRDLKEQEVSEVFEIGREQELQASSWPL